MLSAAVHSAASLEEPEADPSASPVSFRQILAEEAPNKRSTTTEDTKCSWGFDAMPSEKPKGESVYSLQDREREEQAQLKEFEDILEIEAMFAALEVAEQEESREGVASGSASASAPHPGNAGASPQHPKPKTRGGGKQASGSNSRGSAETKGAARSKRNEGDGSQWSSWSADRWSRNSWWRGGWASGWQSHQGDSKQGEQEDGSRNGNHLQSYDAEPREEDGPVEVSVGTKWVTKDSIGDTS